jgi:hypothetical protein
VVRDAKGNFVILDEGNAKLLVLGTDGTFVSESGLAAAAARSLCLLDDGRLIASVLSLGSPLVAIDDTNAAARAVPFPWETEIRNALPDPAAELNEFVRLSGSLLVAAGKSRCLVARQTAPGVALIEADSVRWSSTELGGPPIDSLIAGAATAISLATVGDTALVAYLGIGAKRGRLIDRYQLTSGDYLGTWETPDHISWMSSHDRELAVLKLTATGGQISLWRLR